MECVILYRTHNGAVDFIREWRDGGINIAVYPTMEAAKEDTRTRKLFKALPFQIVELNEL